SPGASWLRKLRPWWGHDDHFHVRLRCPTGDAECQVQEPIPPGDGCGADLAWWFTEEARKPQPRTSVKTPLPVACDAILRKDAATASAALGPMATRPLVQAPQR